MELDYPTRNLEFHKRNLCGDHRWESKYLDRKGVSIKNENDARSLVYFINLIRQISDLAITHVLIQDQLHKKDFDRGFPYKDNHIINHGQLYFLFCHKEESQSITFVDHDLETGICYQFCVYTSQKGQNIHREMIEWVLDSLTDKPNSMEVIKEEILLDGIRYKLSNMACLYHDIDYLLHEGFKLKDIGRSLKRNVTTHMYDNTYFDQILKVETAFNCLFRTPQQICKSYQKNKEVFMATIGNFPFCCMTGNKSKSCQQTIKYRILHDKIPRNGFVQFRDPYDPCIFPLRSDPIITPDDFLFLAHVKKEKPRTRLPKNPTINELDMHLARRVGFNPYLTYEDYIPFAPCRPLSPNHEGSSSGEETAIEGENKILDTQRIFPPLPPEPVRETPPPLPTTSPPQSPKIFDPKSRSPTPKRNFGKRDEPDPPPRSYQPSRNKFPTISGQFKKSYSRPTQFFRERRPVQRDWPSHNRYQSPQRENSSINRLEYN